VKLTVVIPCYNEQNAIEPVIDRFQRVKPLIIAHTFITDVELVVVDDASSDKSHQKLLKRASQFKLVRNPIRLGYGGALKVGFSVAQGD